jgi:hypothetical protein
MKKMSAVRAALEGASRDPTAIFTGFRLFAAEVLNDGLIIGKHPLSALSTVRYARSLLV